MTKPLLLIVDDEPEMAEFVAEAAVSVGFDTLLATSSEEFQCFYMQNKLSGIVMDIVMPDMDGLELVTWLSENQCHIPIIFMSGYDKQYLQMADQIGIGQGCTVLGTLVKPFTREEIEPLFQRVLMNG